MTGIHARYMYFIQIVMTQIGYQIRMYRIRVLDIYINGQCNCSILMIHEGTEGNAM